MNFSLVSLGETGSWDLSSELLSVKVMNPRRVHKTMCMGRPKLQYGKDDRDSKRPKQTDETKFEKTKHGVKISMAHVDKRHLKVVVNTSCARRGQ